MQNQYLSSFTPSLMSSETLEAIFVQREQLAEDLIAGIRESIFTQNKHYRLLTGMRGIGKTHTIALIYHRLREQADLKDRLLIAWLKEEEWGVSSWLDLQISIFQALGNLYPEEYQRKMAVKVEALYEFPPDEATIEGEIILKEFIGDRTLLLLTENLDEIFKGLGDKGQKKFRAYLQNHNLITIVATSQSLFNGVTSIKSPFYGFFNPQRLDKLSLTEATDLLTKISQFKQDAELEKFVRSQTGKDRIKAIHHLAAGNHRVYIIFSQFLTRNSLDELIQPVMQTLDELTPYYQARMQWLSPQQRKIIELLCDRHGAVPVKEIAQRCFISHQTASSQLKDLLTKSYLRKESKGRESFYELQEPLMRICLEAKKQRGEPIKLFIDFLRIWYNNRELEERLKQFPDNCVEKNYILQALKLEQPFQEIESSEIYKQSNNLFIQGILNTKKGNLKTALELFKKAISINSKHNLAWGYHGFVLVKLNRYKESIQSLKKSLEIESNNSRVWNNLGVAFLYLGDYENALKAYNDGLQIKANNFELWYNRGLVLSALSRYKEETESYEKAIEINPNYYQTWFNKGNSLNLLGKHEEALRAYEEALKINSDSSIVNECISTTLYSLGKYEEVVNLCNKAIEICPDNDSALNNRGIALYKLGKYDDAIDSLRMAIKINNENPLLFFNMSEILLKLNRWKEGFETLENALAIYHNLKGMDREGIKGIINLIFEVKQEPNIWQERLKNIIGLYDKYKIVSALGKGITENIPNLMSEMISDKAARTWLEVWLEVGGDKPELEISLRWLKTAVEYKETKGDRRVLLKLPKEERDLFETLLDDNHSLTDK